MKADTRNEQFFIADVDAFDVVARDLDEIMLALERWLARCKCDLDAVQLIWPGMRSGHLLAQEAAAINAAVGASVTAWTRQWERLEPAKTLAKSFDDKVVLLVFGKFNAGKSSFCNVLADRFRSYGKSVEYFHLEAGRIVESAERFAEGATETTSRLQGVRLAGKLVLVDTPGLHSATPENAALTQLFIDSADAVLWLTSSTSPGQVQELDELSRELQRNKPLLPVLTRSDVYEEDEVDGRIIKVLRGKTPENRAAQEADVQARAMQKLATMGVAGALLQAPVSLSAHLARAHGQTRTALAEAGFERLHAGLAAIVEPTLAYKRRKHAEILLHHLEESVLGTLHSDVMPLIAHLRASAAAALDALDVQQEKFANGLWRAVVPGLPAVLDAYAASRDRAVIAGLSQAVNEAYVREVGHQLNGYDVRASMARKEIDAGVIAAGLVDALAIADVPAPGMPCIDYQALYGALTDAVRKHVLGLSEEAVAQCRASITQLDQLAQRLGESIAAHQAALQELKMRLRSQFA